jgi:hypothetical protein
MNTLKVCNRKACNCNINVIWWNDSTRAYYCTKCAHEINESAGFKLCVRDNELIKRMVSNESNKNT